MDPSRPSLGFPLGTALLLIVIFSLSGIISCCYHWDKLRSLRGSFLDVDGMVDPESGIEPASNSNRDLKQNKSQSLPVLMPGDQVPKFIALPCPREPPAPEKVLFKVEKPLKPPLLAVPLYI
ncbi:hypothetical protein HS088_TW13G00947 [Tripterygium wilfordii]|uniref:Hydroxyproline-rich glycoprotein family protein n=2 Tax=Tripterygium wilfordii TaxID=458696 RepID=A0A7J7CVG4_TRIWF|nr:hypothetical protein HS088_TW13G00947 [Tripterygium wilfordii]